MVNSKKLLSCYLEEFYKVKAETDEYYHSLRGG